jgi:diguanylate cyclase (GGDEF)-like protein/PAS domain S-box-containing protein
LFLTKRFISLKWKAFFYTSLLLVVVFGLFMLASGLYSHQLLQEQGRERAQRHVELVDALLDRVASRLQVHVSAFPKYEGITEAMRALDKEALIQRSAAFWEQVSRHEAVTSMVVFSPTDDVLVWRGEPRIPPELLERFRVDWEPRWSLACFDRCELYWVAPLDFDEKSRGTLVLATTLQNLVARFAELSRAQVAIAVRRGDLEDGSDTALMQWDSQVVAVAQDARVLPLLQLVSQQYSRADVFNGVEFQRGDKHFEIVLRPLRGAVFPRQGELLFLTDVSNKVVEYQVGRRNGAIFALVGLCFAELILLSVLWGPLNRLRAIAEILPRLASESLGQIRQLLDGFERSRNVPDESDMLTGAALRLSHLLEELQGEVRSRAEELEKKTVDLEAEKQFVHSLLDTAHALILTQDRNGCIALVNQHCSWITGFDAQELLGKSFFKLLPESEQLPDLRFQLNELLNGFRNELHHESAVVRKDGSTVHMGWYHSLLPQAKEEHQILTIALDISERKEAEERLGWLASHDPLTGLFNRRRFGEELQKSIAHAKRYDRTGAVLFFDLDQFKDVNDTSGHKVGDDLLRRVAECLRQEARDSDLIFRLGGDEFAMIVREVNRESIAMVAKRMCTALARIEVHGSGRLHRVSSSIGIALYPEHGEYVDDLVANADIAMYQAKDAGRNGWHIFSFEEQDRERIHERVYWNEKVKEALSTDSMMVVFQPIQKIGDVQPSHFEALLRVMDENGKPLPTYKFIQSAENSGLIQEVDLRIVDKVLAVKQRLEQQGTAATLSINLSGVSFRNPNLYDEIARKFARYQVNPAEIIFEITETSAVADSVTTISKMKELKKLGCQFALDDFGVGFSSLYQIKLLPIDMVKIDGSFIRHLPQQPEDQALVRAIVEVARVFGLLTVAEFVENEAIVDILRELGVDYAQGYHIAEPRSFERIWGNLTAPL